MNLYQPTITGSLSVSGSVNISGSITIAGGGTISGTASIATTALTASSADNLLVRNTLTATTLVVQTITSSVVYSSGSNVFGNALTNTHVFSGSVTMNPGGLFVSGSGNVGIGTITPNAKLEVNNTSTTAIQRIMGTGATTAQLLMGGSTHASASVGIQHNSSGQGIGDMLFLTSATDGALSERMRITSGSNVGIGTTNPIDKLEVSGAIHTSGTAQNSKGSEAYFDYYQEGSRIGILGPNTSSNGTFKIETYRSNAANQITALYINTSGNVTIGPSGSTSTSKLTSYLGSGIITAGTSNDGLRLQVQSYEVTARNTIVWGQNGGDTILARFGIEWSSPSMDFVWRDMYNSTTGSTEIMRVKGSGQVLIGKTTSTGGKFQVSNGTDMFNVDHDGSGAYITAVNNANTVYKRMTYDASEHVFDIAAAEKVKITSGGNLSFSASNTGIIFNKSGALVNSTFNDYEEGTWTPVVKLDTTTNSSTTAIGVYTKIGRVVYIQCTITGITKSGSGALTVTGLPFTIGIGSTFGDVQATLRWGGISSSGIIIPYFNAGTTYMLLQNFGSSGYNGAISDSACSATYQLYGISGFYMV
jgi:hypothetical protein